jgi:hypothetical protein
MYFVNRLTMTNIASHFCLVPGLINSSNLTMKSIVTSLYGRCGEP